MIEKSKFSRSEIDVLAQRMKDCLEEVGIDGELHLGPGFAGVTALAEHLDGSAIQVVVKITIGDGMQSASGHGVVSDRFDPRLAKSVPTLSFADRTMTAGGGPFGASQDE